MKTIDMVGEMQQCRHVLSIEVALVQVNGKAAWSATHTVQHATGIAWKFHIDGGEGVLSTVESGSIWLSDTLAPKHLSSKRYEQRASEARSARFTGLLKLRDHPTNHLPQIFSGKVKMLRI